MSNVYHFTDTMRLPWILDDGELRPGTCSRVEGFPDMDFVWATTNENGARSAVAFWDNTRYRDGAVWAVRFTLSADDFEPWSEAVKRNPAWTPDLTKCFTDNACGDNPAEWQTHDGSLGRSKWLAIEARSYLNPVWRQVKLDAEVISRKNPESGNPCKTVTFGARMFTSMRISAKPMTYQSTIADLIDRTIHLPGMLTTCMGEARQPAPVPGL